MTMTLRKINTQAALLLWFAPAWCLAQAPPPAGGEVTPPAPTPAELVLDLAPADATFLFYVDSLTALTDNEIARELRSFEGPHGDFVRSMRDFSSGPTLFAFSGVAANPFTWRLTFATFVADAEDPLARIGDKLVPSINDLLGADGVTSGLSFARDGDSARLTLAMPPIAMTLVESEGFVFGSTDYAAVTNWLAGQSVGPSFVDSEEFKKLRADKPLNLSGLVYVNLRMYTPLGVMSMNQEMPRMGDALQLEGLESFMLMTGRPVPPPAPAEDDKAPSATASKPAARKAEPDAKAERDIFRLAIGLSQTGPGPLRIIASAPRPLTLAKYFPAETDALLAGSLPRGSDLIEDLMTALRTIDPVIADEYETERTEFKREAGYDFQSDILANFGPQWAIGGRFADGGIAESLFAVGLLDEELFKTHLHRLRGVYGVESTPNTYRGVTIYTAVRKPRPFSYAIVDRVLLIAPEAQTITDAVDAYTDGKSLADGKPYKAMRSGVSGPESKFVWLNLAAILNLNHRAPQSEDDRAMRDVLRRAPAMGLSVVAGDGVLTADLLSSAEDNQTLPSALARTAGLIIAEERREARRMKSMTNLRTIAVALHLHANDHRGAFPSSLDPAVLAQYLGGEQTARDVLTDPYATDRDSAGGSFYLYRPIADVNAIKNPGKEPVVCEPAMRDGGLIVAFADGHVETVVADRAAEVMKVMKAGR
jgi:prepilin-type processing-associated H-X9-DG protein